MRRTDVATHRSSWKRRECDAARIFGSRRKVLSGSSGRDDQTCSDSDHARLFIESKLRVSWSVRTLWEETRALAREEGKVPVLAPYTKSRPGALIVCHQDDLAAVAAELAGALPEDPVLTPEPVL
jgi:hypothetical protein